KPLLKGYVLHIDNTDPLFIEVKIQASADLIKENMSGGVNLVAQSGGALLYAAGSKSMKASFTTIVPKSKFPSGIVQFTLFSSSGEPLNERLVFIQNSGQLNLAISAAGDFFKTRGKMKIDLGVKDDQAKPASGNFSVAVIDETKVPAAETDESTIFSNLLLTSDLKGYIEKPNYYFTAINEQTKEDLDVLMLTQGYRRFEWQQVLNNNAAPVVYQPESGLQITGHLKTLGGKPVPQGNVSLLCSSQGFFMRDTVADDKGYFAFKNLQFKDSVKFVIQSRKNKNTKNVEIELDSVSTAPISVSRSPGTHYTSTDTVLSAYLDNSKKVYNEEMKYGIGDHARALKEVQIKEKKILPNSSNMNGPGNADQVVLAKDINHNCGDIANCLIGRLTGVFFKFDQDKMVYYPCTYEDGKSVLMKIRVDGISVDAETLNTFPPEIVESVEVLRSARYTSIYGGEGYNGLILINTKKGNFAEAASIRNIVSFAPKGYYKARTFYSPQYDDPKTNMQMADLRSTIYWNPNLVTDKDGCTFFEYFNADTKGRYRVVIEGIDGNGNLGRQVYRYKVE
ncbi:MAG: TonB-dependent receptor, partial [Mucilaginibacter sp.]